MCSTGNSSFIVLEEKNKSRIFKIDDDRTRVWQIYIDRFAADAKAFYITGGEPMIMQDHWMLLDELIKIGKTDTLLQYNINASTLAYKDKHIFDYWDKFSNVKVHCSIDIHEHYAEYVRYGTKWETVLRNLHEIENYFGELHLNTVVTVYTFTHFLEFVDYLEKNFHNVQLHVSLCYGPGWLNPMILPEHIKREHVKLYVEHDYSQLKHVNVVGTELFKNILSKNIKHTQDADSSTLELRKQFIDQTTKYDKIRNQSFESVFDDVYKIVFDERFLTDDKY
jgi:sulfatase maturation enzyme AslB (radical SAM superfamily)